MATFTIDSAPLEAKLLELADKKKDKIMATALRAGAKVFKDEVLAQTPERTDGVPESPKSTPLPPGALKADVRAYKIARELNYAVDFGDQTAHVARFVNDGHRIVVGGRARFDEHGRQKNGPGHQIGMVPGTGFFDKAFETAVKPATEAIEESMVSQIEKAWERR